VLPIRAPDLAGRVFALPPGGAVPGLPDWRWVATPGHTSGHVSYWRASDRVLLVGDAVATMDLDSVLCYAPRPPGLYRPPAPFTSDWAAAGASVRRLAGLNPRVIASGHGRAFGAEDAAGRLLRLADEITGGKPEGQEPEEQRSGGTALLAGAIGAAAGAAAWTVRAALRR
jgi:glyoxylase-like metal-dependent hydrolase (beta-lactamase superfamily II)